MTPVLFSANESERTQKDIRVAHIVPALFSGEGGIIGGAERYAFELARHMAEIVPTSLVAFGDRDREESIGRLRVRVIGKPWQVRGQRTNPFSFRLIPEVFHADVLHCHQRNVLASSVAALCGKFSGRCVFVSDLGGGGWDFSSYFNTDRWFRGHLHISEYSRNISGHSGKPWSHVILGGVDTKRFSPGNSPRSGKVLYVGRILPHKGIDDLIEAMPPDMILEIIGQPYDDRFLRDLKNLAASKQVVFRFDSDDDALIEAYRTALCVVLPSVYKTRYGVTSKVPELLGQTLLEGMACGTPAICTNVASMPEVVKDTITGFIVQANDPSALRAKLLWLREHRAEAGEMGRSARAWVLERFTWPEVVRRSLEIYGRVRN
jgi:glycosyltransferase involved in cell wall biosynthesis